MAGRERQEGAAGLGGEGAKTKNWAEFSILKVNSA